MIGKFIYAWLAQDSGVMGIVGSVKNINPLFTPQGVVYPHVTFQRISGQSISERLAGPGVLAAATVQIDCWGHGQGGYQDVNNLFLAIVGADSLGTRGAKLDGYRGTLGGIVVQDVRLTDERDELTPPESATDDVIQRISLDFRVRYQR